MVVKPTLAADADQDRFVGWSFGNLSSQYKSIQVGSTSLIFSGETFEIDIVKGPSESYRMGSTAYSRNANTIQIIVVEQSSAGTNVFVNNQPVLFDLENPVGSLVADSSPASLNFTDNNIVNINKSIAQPNSPDCCWFEFAIVPEVLTPSNRDITTRFLMNKWQIT